MIEAESGNRRRLQLASFASAFDRFAMPPMLIAIAHDLHVPLSHVVGAASAYFLIYGLMQPIWGLISNRIGLATTIRWCTLAGSLATISAAWVNDITTLAIARAIAGAFFSASIPAALIYVGETAPARNRHREVTHLMTGVALGTALSTAIAGSITEFAGWRWAFAVTGCIGIISSLYISKLVELPRASFRDPFVSPVVTVLKSLPVLTLLTLAVIDGAAILGVLTFIPAAVESTGRNAAVAAGVTATYGIAVLLGARVVGRLSQTISRSRFILGGALIGAVACVLLALSRNLVVVVIACLLLGACWASMHSSLQAWATEVLPKFRSITVSFFAGSLFAGSALAAALGGPLAQNHAYGALFIRGSILLIIIGIAGSIARQRWEQKA
jgi:predicted MFS family arabinose efflux permease